MGKIDRADQKLPHYYNHLSACLATAWCLLERGAKDRNSPFHTLTLATVAANGAPDARTLVLRGVCSKTNRLRFHTDRRTQKLEHLRHDPRCTVLGYDPAAKLQLRLEGEAVFHLDDSIAEDAWMRSQAQSRACYTQEMPPGRPIDEPSDIAPQLPTDFKAGRNNFCVLLIEITRLEWLYLHHLGHRRAAWRRKGTVWDGTWLAT
jgi:hypothetical protein